MGQDGGTRGMREPQESLSLIREFPSVPKATAEADRRTVSLTRGSEVPSGPAVGLLALTADSSLPHPLSGGCLLFHVQAGLEQCWVFCDLHILSLFRLWGPPAVS